MKREFPLDENTLLVKLLQRSHPDYIVHLFMVPELMLDPGIVSFVRYFAKRLGSERVHLRYFSRDGFVLANIIARLTGVAFDAIGGFKVHDDLVRSVEGAALGELNALFGDERLKGIWWFLQELA